MSITPPAGDVGGNGLAPEANAPAPAMPSVADGFTGIPEQFASDPDFANFKSADDVFSEFKQLKGLQANREANGLAEIPGEGSTPEQQQNFWAKMGKPSNAAEYEFKAPEGLPEGLDYSDERAAKFAELAHKNNLTKAQAQGLFESLHAELLVPEFMQGSEAAEAVKDQMITQNFQTLEAKWGKLDSPEFDANHKQALKAFNFVADKEMAEAFKSSPELASNPLVLDLLARLGNKMSPDTAPASTLISKGGSFQGGLEGVEAQIAKFHADGKFGKMLGDTSEAKTLKAEWDRLNESRTQYL